MLKIDSFSEADLVRQQEKVALENALRVYK